MGKCDHDSGPNIVGEFEQRDERGVEKLAHLLRDELRRNGSNDAPLSVAVPAGNARVVTAAVSVPVPSAVAIQRRPAASSARRQTALQKRCIWPPVVRGMKARPHHKQLQSAIARHLALKPSVRQTAHCLAAAEIAGTDEPIDLRQQLRGNPDVQR